MMNIDRSRCGPEYSLCINCKHNSTTVKCLSCVSVVDIGYAMTIYGIPVGSGVSYLHSNFEKENKT